MKKQEARTHKEAPLARNNKSNLQRKPYEPIDDSDAGDLIQVCVPNETASLWALLLPLLHRTTV